MAYDRPLRPNELYHHGILGQKWGVRRYQNKDGSLTSAGRKHRDLALKEMNETIGRSSKTRAFEKEDYEQMKKDNFSVASIASQGDRYLKSIYKDTFHMAVSDAIRSNALKPGTDYVNDYVPNSGVLINKRRLTFTNTGSEKLLDISDKALKTYEKKNKNLIKEVEGYKQKSEKAFNDLVKKRKITDPDEIELLRMEYYDVD